MKVIIINQQCNAGYGSDKKKKECEIKRKSIQLNVTKRRKWQFPAGWISISDTIVQKVRNNFLLKA